MIQGTINPFSGYATFWETIAIAACDTSPANLAAMNAALVAATTNNYILVQEVEVDLLLVMC